MSSCKCGLSKRLRVSDEGIYQDNKVRLRCMDCGGKAGFLPLSDLERICGDVSVQDCAEPGELFPTVCFNVSYESGPRAGKRNGREHPEPGDLNKEVDGDE